MLSEQELIKKAQKGDKQSFEELFNKYRKKIMNYLYHYIRDYQKAEDVLIETFLEVYRRLPLYEERGKFSSWVFRIAINYAKTEFRKNRKKEVLIYSSSSEGDTDRGIEDISADNTQRPDHQTITNELNELVKKSIDELDEKYKNVILLCDIEGLSYEEVAVILKCRKNAVGTRLHRARKLFYEKLNKHGYQV